MLSEEEWNSFEKLVNGEYMAQVDDSGFEAALYGVQLALLVVAENHALLPAMKKAIDFLSTFGRKENLPLPNTIKRELYVRHYGEEEVQAMERSKEISFEEGGK